MEENQVSARHKRVVQEVERLLSAFSHGQMSTEIRDSHLKLWHTFAEKWDLSRTRKPETWVAGVVYTFSRMVFGELSQTDVAVLLDVSPATVGQKFIQLVETLDLRTLDSRFVPSRLQAEIMDENPDLPADVPLVDFSPWPEDTAESGSHPDASVSPLDLVYDGWEALDHSDTPEGRHVASRAFRTALLLDPTLADAHNGLAYLAELDGEFAEAERRYHRAYRVARDKLGSESPDKFAWWSNISTRPYMRARYGLGWIYWQTGRTRKAIAEYEALLKLNPNDNQGVRYFIAPLYQLEDDLAGAMHAYNHYVRAYPNDAPDPHYLFSWGLALLQSGDGVEALRKWRYGFFQNPYIAPLLLGKQLPDHDIWLSSSLSYPDYAQDYIDNFLVLWLRTPEALIGLRALWTHPQVQTDMTRWLTIGEKLAGIAKRVRNRVTEATEATWQNLIDEQYAIETQPLPIAVITQLLARIPPLSEHDQASGTS